MAAPGDAYLTRAGTVHALGGGLTLLEIQQVSDVTYRLYDYQRGRELHLEKGLAVLDPGPHPGKSTPEPLAGGGAVLARSPYFETELWTLDARREFPSGSVLILLEAPGGSTDKRAGRARYGNSRRGPASSRRDGSNWCGLMFREVREPLCCCRGAGSQPAASRLFGRMAFHTLRPQESRQVSPSGAATVS